VGLPVLSLALLAVLGAVSYTAFVRGLERPVRDEDRAVLVTLAELKPWLDQPPPGTERLRHSRRVGSREILYEFRSAPGSPRGLYVNCTVTIESSLAAAQVGYRVISTGVTLGLKVAGGDVRIETESEGFGWGDESSSSTLLRGGDAIGHVFSARKGERLFSLVVAGVAFKQGVPAQLLQPVLSRLEAYPPK
jgi:hypothetical protein